MTDLTKEYFFNNSVEELFPLTERIMSLVSADILRISADEDTLSKLRQVIIELLTNGVKHSNCAETSLRITLSGDKIGILKKDSGSAFPLEGCGGWPLDEGFVGKRITIHKSDFSLVSAVIESSYSLTFESEDFPIEAITFESNFSSHYGLLILCKASEHFGYHYDQADHSNNFSLTLRV